MRTNHAPESIEDKSHRVKWDLEGVIVQPGWMQDAHKSHSITLPPQLDRREKNTMKGSWVETRTGRDHSPFTVMGKTDST